MTHLVETNLVPQVIFKTRVGNDAVCGDNTAKWVDLTTDELFMGKKIILFAIPGAYTPTCSSLHAPGYEKHYDEFKVLGIDEVVCLSVNDAFVMSFWQKSLMLKKIFMLPDGNGDFTREMGLLVKKNNLGFGERSWRYSMFVENGVIRKMFIEEGISDNCETDPFLVSDADTMLSYLKNL